MFRRNPELEQEHAVRMMARGKDAFIWRQGIFPTLVNGYLVVLVLQFWPERSSLLEALIIASIMLPIFLVGGYLKGRWKWEDLEKKYLGGRS